MFYKLVNRIPVLLELDDYAAWLADPDRENESIVAQDTIGDVLVSTVFLSVDHGFDSENPQLFETAVFEDARPRNINRYSTWEAAEAGHQIILERERENHAK